MSIINYHKSLGVGAILVLLVLCCSNMLKKNTDTSADIDRFFLEKLNAVEKELQILETFANRKEGKRTLQNQFKNLRLAYKQLAVLTDHFYPYETRLLNGPALKRVEEDNPSNIIEPHGFQVIEELLWQKSPSTALLVKEIEIAQEVLKRLRNQPDRIYQFTAEQVWQAMHAAMIRVATTGLTGLDCPVSLHALPEAEASIKATRELLGYYREGYGRLPAFGRLMAALDDCLRVLQARQDFNTFNRLEFISRYANPATKWLAEVRITGGLTSIGRYALVQQAGTIFDSAAFDIGFFSPNERYRPTKERIELGRRLFYDERLSSNGDRSCGSCHDPAKAFTDGLPRAVSVEGKPLLRNTPTLWNSVFQTRQFYDSRSLTLETQLSDVVHNTEEMKGSLSQSVEDLAADKAYRQLFEKAYPQDKPSVSPYNIANAISSYVRSLVALNSRFDLYMRGNYSAMSSSEQKGFNLFTGKAKCATCHFLPLFNGLVPPAYTETESEVLGLPASAGQKPAVPDQDEGKFNHTGAIVHRFSFKTPTLRNITLTAPYMHNGIFGTLEEVVDFYNKGGGNGLKIAPETQTLPAERLGLSKKEQRQLIAFLHTLTDTSAIR
ncbi:MAG TPA: cytochrome c peroxidase [Flavisolibacter sp.]|nr:cytochrome c peroxidase [Flavisolibacter sp.]